MVKKEQNKRLNPFYVTKNDRLIINLYPLFDKKIIIYVFGVMSHD